MVFHKDSKLCYQNGSTANVNPEPRVILFLTPYTTILALYTTIVAHPQ